MSRGKGTGKQSSEDYADKRLAELSNVIGGLEESDERFVYNFFDGLKYSDIGLSDSEGKTLLSIAVYQNKPVVFMLVLLMGAKIDLKELKKLCSSFEDEGERLNLFPRLITVKDDFVNSRVGFMVFFNARCELKKLQEDMVAGNYKDIAEYLRLLHGMREPFGSNKKTPHTQISGKIRPLIDAVKTVKNGGPALRRVRAISFEDDGSAKKRVREGSSEASEERVQKRLRVRVGGTKDDTFGKQTTKMSEKSYHRVFVGKLGLRYDSKTASKEAELSADVVDSILSSNRLWAKKVRSEYTAIPEKTDSTNLFTATLCLVVSDGPHTVSPGGKTASSGRKFIKIPVSFEVKGKRKGKGEGKEAELISKDPDDGVFKSDDEFKRRQLQLYERGCRVEGRPADEKKFLDSKEKLLPGFVRGIENFCRPTGDEEKKEFCAAMEVISRLSSKSSSELDHAWKLADKKPQDLHHAEWVWEQAFLQNIPKIVESIKNALIADGIGVDKFSGEEQVKIYGGCFIDYSTNSTCSLCTSGLNGFQNLVSEELAKALKKNKEFKVREGFTVANFVGFDKLYDSESRKKKAETKKKVETKKKPVADLGLFLNLKNFPLLVIQRCIENLVSDEKSSSNLPLLATVSMSGSKGGKGYNRGGRHKGGDVSDVEEGLLLLQTTTTTTTASSLAHASSASAVGANF